MTLDPLQATLERARRARERTGKVSPMERILSLDDEDLFHQAEDLALEWTRRLRKHPQAPTLRPIQGLVLETAHRQRIAHDNRGVLGNIKVGGGKTLIFFLLPEVYGAQRPAYLFPPKLLSTIKAEQWKWARHYYIHDSELIPYSVLSRPESTDLLRRVSPDLVMADECQNLRNHTAARTKRFVRYMQENPDTRFVGLTGTLTKGSVKDYAHLAELSLREGAPVPLSENDLSAWAAVLDADGEPRDTDRVALQPLVDRYADDLVSFIPLSDDPERDRIRRAYYQRLRTTPGFVLTHDSSCDARIVMEGLSFGTPQALRDAIATAANDYTLPNGDELDLAMHIDQVLMNLCLGFYYVWDWPGEPDQEWLDCRNEWGRQVRAYLKTHAREGVDSPHLVEKYIREGRHRADAMTEALEAWDQQRHKPQPPTKPIWLDYTPILKAVEWAHQQPDPVFLWWKSRAVADALAMFGVPVLDGQDPNPRAPVQGLSIGVYNAGWNLQKWHRQLILEPPSNPVLWEQLLGRTHRQGQTASTIQADVLQHLWPLRRKMGRAIQKAQVIQVREGQPQKLLFADRWNIGPRGMNR